VRGLHQPGLGGLGEKIQSWLQLAEEPSIWISAGVSALVLLLVMRRG
jgi:hypothetical protein